MSCENDCLTAWVETPTQPMPPTWASVLDGIIVINLDGADSRRLHVKNQFTDFFGLQPSHITILRRKRDYTVFNRGCYESHRAACQYALAQGWKRTLICEDDLLTPTSDNKKAWKMMNPMNLGQRLDSLPADWYRYMLGYIPIIIWPGEAGMKGITLCTTTYIASDRYCEFMDARPNHIAGEHCVDKRSRCIFGGGLDHWFSAKLARVTHVAWPAPILVDPKEGSKGTHGTFWEEGVSTTKQHTLQHLWWVVPLGVVVVLGLVVVLPICVALARTKPRVALIVGLSSLTALTLITFFTFLGFAVSTVYERPEREQPLKEITMHVDTKEGMDQASGESPEDPLQTLERAQENVLRRALLMPDAVVKIVVDGTQVQQTTKAELRQ